jgi:predicted oxidoreductase
MEIAITPIVAGTMLWGKWGRKLSTGEIASLMHHFVDNDITTFDHADIYGGYTTEAEFGEGWEHSGIARDKIQLISKCGIRMVSENRNHRIGHYDYDAAYIMDCCDRSLQNLKTDYLDLFLMHRPSPLMEGEVIAEAASRLTEQGKIRSFGLSNFTPSQTELVRKYIPVSYNQIEFSVTHHSPLTDGQLDHMMLHNIRPMAWAPLGTVFKDDSEDNRRIRKVLDRLSKKYNVEHDIILINWVMRHPSRVIPVVGTADLHRIMRLRQALSFTMEREDWFELYIAGMGHPVP